MKYQTLRYLTFGEKYKIHTFLINIFGKITLGD